MNKPNQDVPNAYKDLAVNFSWTNGVPKTNAKESSGLLFSNLAGFLASVGHDKMQAGFLSCYAVKAHSFSHSISAPITSPSLQ